MSLNAYSQSLEALRNQKSHELKEVGDQWRTPELLFWGINAMFGPLMLDLFADDSNAKCPVWYTSEDNALTQDWSEMLIAIGGAAFGNPPYSRSQYDGKQAIIGMSHIMSYASAMREKGGRYVFLIKAAPSETWWPEDADHIVFIRGRIGFDLPAWFIPADEKQQPTSAFFAGAIVVFDKAWRGERFSYIHRSDLEAKGRANRERELSIAELCWWAVSVGVADAIPESMAARALRLPYEPFPAVYRESDIVAADNRPSLALQKKASKVVKVQEEQEQPTVLALRADPESPESFMLRPKRRRWTCAEYTRWVKAQPCSGCLRPADDPHHVLGHGLGGTATKAHDLFVIPLCRECHDKLHADVAAFEQKYGTQLELLFRFLDRALAIGVIVKA